MYFFVLENVIWRIIQYYIFNFLMIFSVITHFLLKLNWPVFAVLMFIFYLVVFSRPVEYNIPKKEWPPLPSYDQYMV